MNKMQLKRFLYNWIAQFCNPIRLLKGFTGLFWFWRDYFHYKQLTGAEPLRIIEMSPALQERGTTHEMDAHYFYVNSWAMRLIIKGKPRRHVDVASQTILAALLSTVIPVIYVDYRILDAKLSNLTCVSGSLTNLPLTNNTIESLSCLHVAEHVGLGRYGDILDPRGTQKAAEELQRVLSLGGNLYFAVPVGRQRVCFNAHRVHSAETICKYFKHLELVEYSGVHDDGRFVENVELTEFRNSNYALGMFWFKKSTVGKNK